MLDLSRLQAQGIDESRKTRFDLGDVMGDVLITFEQKINARGLQVSVDLPEKPVWTKADRDAITQVVYNLLDNAIKFCPVGGNLGLILEQDGQKARLRIRNTGQTIPPEELPLLFGPLPQGGQGALRPSARLGARALHRKDNHRRARRRDLGDERKWRDGIFLYTACGPMSRPCSKSTGFVFTNYSTFFSRKRIY